MLLTLLKDFFFLVEPDSPFKAGAGRQSLQKKAEMSTCVLVVHTLQECVRGNLPFVGGDAADVLIWAPDVMKNASAHFRVEFHGSKCHGL